MPWNILRPSLKNPYQNLSSVDVVIFCISKGNENKTKTDQAPLKMETITCEEILKSDGGITFNKVLLRFEFPAIASACYHSALNHSWCRIFWYTGNKNMTPAEDYITLQLKSNISSHSHSRFESLKFRHYSCNKFGSLQADSVVLCVCVCVLCIFSWFYSVTVANQSCGMSVIRL